MVYKTSGNNIKDIRILTGNGFLKKERNLIFFSQAKEIFKFGVYENSEGESQMNNLLNLSLKRLKDNSINKENIHYI